MSRICRSIECRGLGFRLLVVAVLGGVIGTATSVYGADSGPTSAIATDDGPMDELPIERTFMSPPKACRPWVYWWWLNANVTESSITKDLEAMARQGFGGFLLFDVTAYGHEIVAPPQRKIEFMSPRWRELVRFALGEARRLGLQASINLSTSGGALQAPWDMQENAVQRLVWTATEVRGTGWAQLDRPPSTARSFNEVAVLAVRIDPPATAPASADPRTDNGDDAAGGTPDDAEDRGAGDVAAHGRASDTADTAAQNAWIGPTSPWTAAQDRLPDDAATAAEVVDLTQAVDAQGRLRWQAPAGRWIVLRLACVSMDDRAEHVDILSARAVESHFERMGRALLADAGSLAPSTLTHFYNVSWEGETPSWTSEFKQDFRRFRGYEIRPYLPILAGIRVGDQEVSTRFLRDYALTVADCFANNCYRRFDERCREAGLRWHSESGGPWRRDTLLFREADQLAFWGRNAMPQGEFWVPDYRSNVRHTAMAAHIYGHPLVAVEAFTHMTHHWSQYPATLKWSADRALCDGATLFVWHTSSASPDEYGEPGIVYFAGTHINRHVTWYEYARGFVDYLARAQTLLRRGRFVADVCCYTSHRYGVNWTRGRQWGDKPTRRLPPGYSYDLINVEALIQRIRVAEDGDLVLPDGMRYRMLVVDLEEETMPIEALRKVLELIEAGATVVLGDRAPVSSPGLADHPRASQQVRELAARLWVPQRGTRRVGKGRVITGTPLSDVLSQEGILPDCEGTEDFIHRRDADTDIYFVAGEGQTELTFRIAGREPELWDPVSGRTRAALEYATTDDGRVRARINLPKNGAQFVVFRRPKPADHFTKVIGPAAIDAVDRDDNRARVRFWQNGDYEFLTAKGQSRRVTVVGLDEPLALDESWELRFAPGWGTPESIRFDRLTPWDTHVDPEIKYFSGTATYRKTLTLTEGQAGRLLRLRLGRVGCIARVRLNDVDCGVAWTDPWTTELTGAARAGENRLQVEVANVWQNRLIGDAGLPESQRRTRTNVILEQGPRTRRFLCSSVNSIDPLTPSGLMGPVRLEFGVQQDVAFD